VRKRFLYVVNCLDPEHCEHVFYAELFLVGYQISIGKQWKEFLDYKDSIGFIVHVSNALSLPFLFQFPGQCVLFLT
jgi:hypothetical protein